MHQIIGVKDCLAARGMLIDTSCPLCQCRSESIMHALRDCRIVRTTWHQLGVYHTNTSFFSANLQDWLTSNCKAAGYHAPGQPPSIAVDIINWALQYTHCACKPLVAKRMVMKRIQWEKPSNSWMKLNTDGSSLGNPGVDGGGGLIRDENGNWVVGLARRIGIANSFMAELCALCDGLLLCLQFNIQAIIIKLDARAIVDAFNHQSNSNTIIFSIMDDCRQLVT